MEKIKSKVRGTLDLDRLRKQGFVHGRNFKVMGECIIDPGHCFLIKVGDNVTLAPRVHILAHDASTKNILGYTRVAKVDIGNFVFVGAGTIILPGITIGNNVVIGAGSVVTKNIPDNTIVAGNPAKKIADFGIWIEKRKKELEESNVFDESYIIGNITVQKKEEMIKKLTDGKTGYII
jgi:maltose O-acetyltransferase